MKVPGAAIFVILCIVDTKRQGLPSWKSSSLATMLYSLDSEARQQLRADLQTQSFDEASATQVFLQHNGEGLELSIVRVAAKPGKRTQAGDDSWELESLRHAATRSDSVHAPSSYGHISQDGGLYASETTLLPRRTSSVSLAELPPSQHLDVDDPLLTEQIEHEQRSML